MLGETKERVKKIRDANYKRKINNIYSNSMYDAVLFDGYHKNVKNIQLHDIYKHTILTTCI